MLPFRLSGSGLPSAGSTAELGKAGAGSAAWQGGKERRKQGSLKSPVARRAEEQCLTQSHPGSKLEGTGREQAIHEEKTMCFSCT